jgi:type IX secretion system PorP/SprF family membrane protein
MKNLKLYIGIAILFVSIFTVAQDVHFSQLNMSPLLLNPANAGAFKGNQRVVANYRDQWRSVAAPYSTFALAADMAMLKSNSGKLGVGIQLFRDKAGDLSMGTTSAIGNVAYHVKINNKQNLSAGISGGIAQRNANLVAGRYGNQYDGQGHSNNLTSGESFNSQNFIFGDFSGGLLWNYSSSASTISSKDGIDATVGVSYQHFNRPKRSLIQSDERFYAKTVAHALVSYGIKNTSIELQPAFYYFMQGNSKETVAGVNFRYVLKEESKYTGLVKGAAVSLGGYYRIQDAAIIAATIEYGSYTIGLSYDVNTSKLRSASNYKGGFEISLAFRNPNPFLYKGSSGSVKFL